MASNKSGYCGACRERIGPQNVKAMRDERVDDERRQRASGDIPDWFAVPVRVSSLEGKSSGTVTSYSAATETVKVKLDSSGASYSMGMWRFIKKYQKER